MTDFKLFWLVPSHRRDFVVVQAVQRIHQSVDFCLVLAAVHRRVGDGGQANKAGTRVPRTPKIDYRLDRLVRKVTSSNNCSRVSF